MAANDNLRFGAWDPDDYEAKQPAADDGPMNTSATGGYKNFLRKNTKSFDNFKYFLEGIDATHQNLDQLTPYIQGISRLYFHKTPYFMSRMFPDLTDHFRSYIETGYKSIQGINDLTATEATVEGGWANQKMDNMSIVTDDTNQVDITMYELTGSPIREFIETWMTGIRDPRSGVAHYHGGVKVPVFGGDYTALNNAQPNAGDGISYGEKNHTGEFIYVALDPTAQFIEYACMLAHVWPKNVPKSHLNYQSGTRDLAEVTLTFSCVKYESKFINDIAAYYVAKSNLIYDYLEFNPHAGTTSAYASRATRQTATGESLDTYMKYTTHHAGTEDMGTTSASSSNAG